MADVTQTVLPPKPSSALVPKKPWIMRLGKELQPRINRLCARNSKIGDHPFYDTKAFPLDRGNRA